MDTVAAAKIGAKNSQTHVEAFEHSFHLLCRSIQPLETVASRQYADHSFAIQFFVANLSIGSEKKQCLE